MRAKLAAAYATAGGDDERAARMLRVSLGSSQAAISPWEHRGCRLTSNGQRHGLRDGFQRPWKGDRQCAGQHRWMIESFGRYGRAGRPFCHAPTGTTSRGFRRNAQRGLSSISPLSQAFAFLSCRELALGCLWIDFCQSLKRGDCQNCTASPVVQPIRRIPSRRMICGLARSGRLPRWSKSVSC